MQTGKVYIYSVYSLVWQWSYISGGLTFSKQDKTYRVTVVVAERKHLLGIQRPSWDAVSHLTGRQSLPLHLCLGHTHKTLQNTASWKAALTCKRISHGKKKTHWVLHHMARSKTKTHRNRSKQISYSWSFTPVRYVDFNLSYCVD